MVVGVVRAGMHTLLRQLRQSRDKDVLTHVACTMRSILELYSEV